MVNNHLNQIKWNNKYYWDKIATAEVKITNLYNRDGEMRVNGWGTDDILRHCTWLDGTPCGKLKE